MVKSQYFDFYYLVEFTSPTGCLQKLFFEFSMEQRQPFTRQHNNRYIPILKAVIADVDILYV